MKSFESFSKEIRRLIEIIISNPEHHMKWLNTLSFLENCGAKKIAASEHRTLVREQVLKHAAEEFRHAHSLKKQIEKITKNKPLDYSMHSLLGGITSLNYLEHLDLGICRFLSILELPKSEVRETAYHLVTYAIELRAQELYPIYHEILKKINSPVSVKAIILEEENHLKEIEQNLKDTPTRWVEHACKLESALCSDWIKGIQKDIKDLKDIKDKKDSKNEYFSP